MSPEPKPKSESKEPKGRTYTISVTQTLEEWVTELMRKKGYNNVSAYMTDLIRRDKERQEIKEGLYPPYSDVYGMAAETPSHPVAEEDRRRKKAKGR